MSTENFIAGRISTRRWSRLLPILTLLIFPQLRLFAQTQTRQVPVDSLIFDLKNPDPVRRKDAATQLGNNKVARAVPDLVAAAGDSDAGVRREIAFALDKIADARAIPAFVNLIGDTEKDIAEKAIAAFVSLYLPQERGVGSTFNKVANFFNPWSDEWAEVIIDKGLTADASGISALRSRLSAPDEGIRGKSARALGILRGKDAVPAIVESLGRERSNIVKFEDVRALRKINDTSTAPEVMNYISYNDVKVRNESVYTLGRFRYKEAVPEFIRLFEHQSALPKKQSDQAYKDVLMESLAFIGDPSAKDLFLKEKNSAESNIRLRAVEGLARIGDPSIATDISRDMISEKEPRVKTAQAYALYRMGRVEYLDAVARALANRKTSQEAQQYLVELKPSEFQALYGLARIDDAGVREGLAEVYGIIGDRDAIPVLQEMSKDTRGQVSAFANQAIRKISARTGN
jgi:HEAT repeat protein